jgi:hypothetical protein
LDDEVKLMASTAFDSVVAPVPEFVMLMSPTTLIIDVPPDPMVTLLYAEDMMMFPVEFPPAQLKFE